MAIEECPRCGQPLIVRRWNDDVGMVEIKKECSCGYIYHWSYGSVMEDSDLEEDW